MRLQGHEEHYGRNTYATTAGIQLAQVDISESNFDSQAPSSRSAADQLHITLL